MSLDSRTFALRLRRADKANPAGRENKTSERCLWSGNGLTKVRNLPEY
jgi:hypothetical protein